MVPRGSMAPADVGAVLITQLMVSTTPNVFDGGFPKFLSPSSSPVSSSINHWRPCTRCLSLFFFFLSLSSSHVILNPQSKENSQSAVPGVTYIVPLDLKLLMKYFYLLFNVFVSFPHYPALTETPVATHISHRVSQMSITHVPRM